MDGGSARTPLCDWHAAHGGRLVDFAGWSMPTHYTSIVKEHEATRTGVGLFDISHMGRLVIAGSEAATLVDHAATRRVSDMRPGQIRYSLITNQLGGILDDVLIYRNPPAQGAPVRLVVNACNRQKILAWLEQRRDQRSGGPASAAGVTITDQTAATAMIAVQGPRAMDLLQPLVDVDLAPMKYYTAAAATIADTPGSISRTGYTGEDGFELIVAADRAVTVWEELLDAGRPHGAVPAGLGCRDTLRLEAAMPLYGHELTEQVNPVQAGLMFAVDLEGRDFPGCQAIAEFERDPGQPKRVGLKLNGRRVPRQGHAVRAGSEPVGKVTSGTFSPTFGVPIAMAYVDPAVAREGVELNVDIRGHTEPATVVRLPFYRRGKVTR